MTRDDRKRADIAQFAERGDENRSNNDFKKAIDNYRKAYNLARDLNNDKIERLCALNLGAACIGADDVKEGLSYLHKATPPNNERDEPSNGALFFNKGLGYEKLGDMKNALENFKYAYEEYKIYERYETDVLIHSLEKCLNIYEKQKKHLEAADICKELAEIFNGLSRASKLCERITHLRLGVSDEESEKEADELLESVNEMKLEGQECLEAAKILNDIGLAFTLIHKYDKARVCFEKAEERLLCSHIHQAQLEAVIKQNLGAVYNFIGEYQRAVKFHEDSILIYGKTKNRNSQGQCFINLAYAHTQCGDFKQAQIAFHQSLQAAMDSEDTHMEWQAYEGLGAVNYFLGDYQAAVDNYLKALQTIKPWEIGSDRIKKKIYRATAQLYAGKPDSGRPAVLDRHLRTLHIDEHPVLNEEHPVLFEEHAQVGVTPRERYKAETFVSEPPMMAKVDDHHLTNQPLQRHQKKKFVPVRKKDSVGPHLPKMSRGISSSLGFNDSPRMSLRTSHQPMLEVDSTSDDSSRDDDDSTSSDDTTINDDDDNVKTQTAQSPVVDEIFRRTNQSLQETTDEADVSLQRYQEQLKKKEAMDNIEEDSEESSDSTFTDSSDDDSSDSETTQEEIQTQPKPSVSRTHIPSPQASQTPPPPPTQSPPNTALASQGDLGTYLKPQVIKTKADVHTSVSSSRVAKQQEPEVKSPRESGESSDEESDEDASPNVDDETDPKTLYSTVDKTQRMETRQAKTESGNVNISRPRTSSTDGRKGNFFDDSDSSARGETKKTEEEEEEDPYHSLKFERNEEDESDDNGGEEKTFQQLPRGQREVIMAEYHRDHEMSHGSNTEPPPLPARGSAKEDKKDSSSSKTCSIM
ncbi:tetratricopeptide repeat [Mactra antiquata]